MTVRWFVLLTLSILCAAAGAPSAANTDFLTDNCNRTYDACASKCVPEIKLVPGKDGAYVYKADGRKVPSCRLKCITAQNTCRATAASAAPTPERVCTTSAQCRAGEGCFDGRCMAH